MKNIQKPIFFFFFLALTSFLSKAQNHTHCGTDEFTEILINENPEIAEKYAATREAVSAKVALKSQQNGTEAAPIYQIPVVFHVIYDSECDNISKAQILDGLEVLNEDFRRQNPDANQTRPIFQSVAADVEVEFVLAGKDPQGNCTDGITRTQDSRSVQARDNVKDIIQWDNDKYLNIWVVNSIQSSSSSLGIVLGYAYRPFFNQGFKQDGIVIRHDRLGSIGTADGVAIGRTLTHEVGHYLGLLHPFSNGCFGSGDQINDTPPVANANFGCSFSANSCSNDSPDLPDMIENYMDYADDVCTNLFTLGQKNAMRASLDISGLRKELREASNLTATGVTSPPACAPSADFALDAKVVCEGGSVTFRDVSEDGVATSWQWTFPGGTPNSSTAASPTVSYPALGDYDVTLTVSNAAGSSTKLRQDVIQVMPIFTNNNASWNQDFESGETNDYALTSDIDTNTFSKTNLAAASGSSSLFLDNFNTGNTCGSDFFVSPVLNTKFGQQLNFEFDYAFAARDASNTDQLLVQVSTDCGATWIQRQIISGGQLRTTTNFEDLQPFVPTVSDWRTGSTFLQFYEDKGPILVRLEFISGGGNNFYLDNVRFTASNIGLGENLFATEFEIFPNPATSHLNIQFGAGLEFDTELRISDLNGKVLKRFSYSKETAEATLNVQDFPKGLYIFSFENASGTISRKVVVE